jgi:hypothetical protein
MKRRLSFINRWILVGYTKEAKRTDCDIIPPESLGGLSNAEKANGNSRTVFWL